MLQIKNISKQYVTGDLVQNALNDVSLNLRDNEFVAILGPSGSGKTTLLNVIGGLDRYDKGDLIINGISTKNYKDRDWDSYRNHTIGFVFQSYNLIPHQNILSNVELALTISGISKKERRNRAIKALEEVGLGNQLHKKPTQMSGGQMQRVAIARALVNNPDILLADEPTGALDTETSVQVMELLKEVAKDRLVVMVTHNPELAEEYATRIVRLKDGKITSDNDPFIVNAKEAGTPVHKNMGKTSMSFLTSLSLSFNNLKTKKARTFLTAFAGSIGIIGIAAILSLSNGVNTYIHDIEEETLSEYPLTITSSNVDLSSMISMSINAGVDESKGEEINERKTISSFFSTSKKNDLKSLRTYLESDESHVYEYANAIEYEYTVTPQIYRMDSKEYHQINPNESFKDLNNTYGSFATNMPYNVFNALPENDNLYKSSYDVIEGHWPENSHEMILVLSSDNCVTDVCLYALGLKDSKELDRMMKDFKNGKEVTEVSEQGKYKYTDFLGKKFKLVNICDTYQYDSERNLYVDKSDNKDYMLNIINNSDDLEIVGIVKQKDASQAGMLMHGVYYPYQLKTEIVQASKDSAIVKEQLKHPKINVFTGKRFDDETKDNPFADLFKFDTSKLADAFNVDTSVFDNLDFSNIKIDPSKIKIDMPGMEGIDFSSILSKINIKVNAEGLATMFDDVTSDYLKYAAKNPATDYAKLSTSISDYLSTTEAQTALLTGIQSILSDAYKTPTAEQTTAFVSGLVSGFETYMQSYPEATMEELGTYLTNYLNTPIVQQQLLAYAGNYDISGIDNEQVSELMQSLVTGYNAYAKKNKLPDPSKFQESFTTYLQSERGKKAIADGIDEVIDTKKLQKQFASAMGSVMKDYSDSMGDQMESVMEEISKQITEGMTETFGSLSTEMQNMFQVDQNALAEVFKMDIDPKEMQEIMMAMMSEGTTSYESNLTTLNYCDLDDPTQISIYPKDFDNKTNIIELLDNYNERMEKTDKDKVVGFTDYVATLMTSVTDIIDTISYVLIAFVAISLIVSSIMIGIITYISVLERTKEIGILRAIGASKSNVSQVFNAETFIIGFLAGVLGIVTTLILLIPGNMLIDYLTDGKDVRAALPWQAAIILIIISIILTLIGGLIPARAAAKKDPVTALRSE